MGQPGYGNMKNNMKNNSRPLFFSEFGQQSSDVLGKGYSPGNMVVISTRTACGLKLTSTASDNYGQTSSSSATVRGEYSYKDAGTVAVQFGTRPYTPSLPQAFAEASLEYPNWWFNKLRLWATPHRNITLAVRTNLHKAPKEFAVSGSIGTPSFGFGMEGSLLGFTPRGCFTICEGGLHVTKPTFEATLRLSCASQSLKFHNKGLWLKASFVHHLDKAKKISTAIKVTRSLQTHKNNISVGGSWIINNRTVVKAKVDNLGNINTLLQHDIHDKACLSFSSEFDIKALDKNPRIGLSLLLKP